MDTKGFFTHDASKSGNLLNGLPARPQSQGGQECAHLRWSCYTCHNLFHSCYRFFYTQRASCSNMGNSFANHYYSVSSSSTGTLVSSYNAARGNLRPTLAKSTSCPG